ncbi:MAG: helix-turn-helix domain-containing protein [Gallionella sp.]|nr:helix-turn-helix domain-containing protein [Gallionella sp.]MDD4946550.1 helix-turn-helix domain-containing protein [Gallionella sp.]
MGLILLLALSGLQFSHFAWLYLDQAWVSTTLYRMTLFAVAPAFFLFSQPLLHPQQQSRRSIAHLWHVLPVALSPLLPNGAALPLAFIFGVCYLLWLVGRLYALRAERANFHLEMLLLGSVIVIAIAVSALGLVQAAMPEKLFFCVYAISIGAAFLLVQTTLSLRPQLSTEVSEAVQAAYANSTLSNVDCDAVLSKLEVLMQIERLYEDAELNLPRLSARLEISTHQLSELMNSRLGKGFSRYLRELRIEAAKSFLRGEPSASVLSVGLSVGFTSQSNFYEAFREIEGMTPGQYRKLVAKDKSPE